MGFQLGDMCYHAIHVHKGSFFRLKDHLDRWETSISKRGYTSLGYDREQVAEVLHGCVACGNLRDSMVTFVATRGSPSPTHNDFADFVFLLRRDDDAARILGTLTVTAEREPAHMQAELVQTLHQKSRLAATVEFECPPSSATNFVISISSSSSKLSVISARTRRCGARSGSYLTGSFLDYEAPECQFGATAANVGSQYDVSGCDLASGGSGPRDLSKAVSRS